MNKKLVILIGMVLFGFGIGLSVIYFMPDNKPKAINKDNNEQIDKTSEQIDSEAFNNEVIDNNVEAVVSREVDNEQVINNDENKKVEEKKTITSESNNKTESKKKEDISNNISEDNVTEIKKDTFEPKVYTDDEIEKIARNVISDFRLDFKDLKSCETEGESWSEYGWGYRCSYVPIPDTDIVASMLILFTGIITCDGVQTPNFEYYFKNAKIGNVAYIRTQGYKCENIYGDVY